MFTHTHTHIMAFWLLWLHSCVFSSGRNFLLEKKFGLSTLRALTDRTSWAPSELPSWTTCTSLPLVQAKLHPVSVFVVSLGHCAFQWISALVFSCFHIASDVQLFLLASFFTDAQIHHTGIAMIFFPTCFLKNIYLFIFGSFSLEESSLQLVGLVSPWHVRSSSMTRDWTLHWKLNCQPLYHQGSPSHLLFLGVHKGTICISLLGLS